MSLEQLKNNLDQMPDCFTSHEFVKALKKKGFSEKLLRNGYALEFLKRNCRQEARRSKVWYKVKEGSGQQQIFQEDDKMEKDAVAYLKSLGYRIMKPVNEWQEM